jgi:protein SCO1/2
MGSAPSGLSMPASLGATLAACLLALAALVVATHALTLGFEAWTYEERRAVDLQQGRIAALPLPLQSSRGESLEPWAGAPGLPRAYLLDFIYTSCPGVCHVIGEVAVRVLRS